MTTLLVSANFPPKTGGSGRWFWELYRRLPRERFLVAAGEDPRQGEVDRLGAVRTFRLPLALRAWGVKSPRGLWGYARAVFRLYRLARREGVTMVHCGRNLPEGPMALALKRLTGIPYACYIHGEEMYTAAASREFTWLVRRVMNGASYIIANSRNTEGLLRREWGIPPDRIRVLHPGVDTTRFVPAPRDEAARALLGWNDRTVVLTVGRLQKRKGHDTMIRALPALRRAVPDLLYAVAGDGEERAPLEKLVDQQGVRDAVQFLGEPDDQTLIRSFQQCDLFVLPNRTVDKDIEGFGIVLLEAQACGKAVVAGDSGGTAETMIPGETGFVVNCDGPENLEALLPELLRDPARRARMGEAGRRWVADHFDWEPLTRAAAQLFQAG